MMLKISLTGRFNIPVYTIKSMNSKLFKKLLIETNPEIIFLGGGWPELIPSWVIEYLPDSIFNTHPSLLPDFRGTSITRWQILEGTELEIMYARDTMPRGVLGMNAAMMEEYLKFIANRRLTQIGLQEEFKGVGNPFPWMSEIIDLRKEKNFFETRVTEYQVGGALNWE